MLEIDQGNTGFRRPIAGLAIVVPGPNPGLAPHQGFGGGQTRTPQAEDGDVLFGEWNGVDQPLYLSFRVDRPNSARIKAMIQNRMTMVDSDQPIFSK